MKKILLRAPLLTNSGYGVHSRQIFDWLDGREDVDLIVECLQWGRTSWIIDEKEENGIVKRIMSKSRPVDKNEIDISIQVQLPDEWDTSLGKFNIGVTALVETDKCSYEWVDKCNSMDHVVVPSTFTKNVLKRSGIVTTKLSVIQEWFNPTLTNKSLNDKILNDDRFKKISDKFNVLMVGTLTSQIPEDDRKNILNTIKWTCEEFKDDENVEIILKTSFGKGSTVDKKMCRDYLKAFKEMHQLPNYPKIKLVHGNMQKEEMSALFSHRHVKCYVTATRGEGYGLPLVEAAAAGIPIVATGWSGHLEFLNKEYFGVVDYDLVEIQKSKIDNRVFKEGFKWANPKEESFKKEIRKIKDDYQSAKQNAKLLMKDVRFNYNRSAIISKYNDLLSEYLEK